MKLIVDALGTIMEIVMLRYFFNIIFDEKKYNKIMHFFWYVLIGLGIYLSSIYVASGMWKTLNCIVLVVLLQILYKGKIIYKFLLSLFISTIYAMVEMLVGSILVLIYGNMQLIKNNTLIFYTKGVFISKFLTLIVTVALAVYKRRKQTTGSTKLFLLMFILPIDTIITIYQLFSNALQINQVDSFNGILAITVLLIITNVIQFYLLDKQAEINTMKIRIMTSQMVIKKQEDFYQDMRNSQDEVRKLAHDMTNYLIGISGLITENKNQQALDYIKKLNVQLVETKIIETGDPIINAVIGAKIKWAKEHDIKLLVKINVSEDILINRLDLAVIIGNGLDNAIEAVIPIQDKAKKCISIKLVQKGNYIVIRMINSTDKDIEIVNNTISTSKMNKMQHGIGLENVKTIANKYNGELFLSFQNREFVFKVILTNKKVLF